MAKRKKKPTRSRDKNYQHILPPPKRRGRDGGEPARVSDFGTEERRKHGTMVVGWATETQLRAKFIDTHVIDRLHHEGRLTAGQVWAGACYLSTARQSGAIQGGSGYEFSTQAPPSEAAARMSWRMLKFSKLCEGVADVVGEEREAWFRGVMLGGREPEGEGIVLLAFVLEELSWFLLRSSPRHPASEVAGRIARSSVRGDDDDGKS